MEDERIAKTILSALLQKQVVAVEMRRHEYPDISRDAISMFRVDFAATIREDNGEERLILIELQKTWLETETLRFRQYLAVQYNNKENMRKETNGKFALPTVAVYLLGHRVEKVLSVFDQSQIYPQDQKVLEVNEDDYVNDEDMAYILRRLQSAASNPEIRIRMNAEDEFFKAVEDRDTTIMRQEAIIKQKDADIKQKDAALLKAALALYHTGMGIEQIADTLNLEKTVIKAMVADSL